MKFKIASIIVMMAGTGLLSACAVQPLAQVYWQRIDSDSALYLKGPKAQQELDENIAACVHEIDELVRLDALRGTTPPDTHGEYHRALDASGDLAYYDTPTRYGDMRVSHSDFHDYESCMRSKGWERVKFVRYQDNVQAQKTYKKTQHFRATGEMVDPDVLERQQKEFRVEKNSQVNK